VEKTKPLTGHGKWITSLSWEPLHRVADGVETCTRFVSASKDTTARVWNIRSGRCEATLAHHTDSVEACAWGGEGLVYTASRDRNIVCWFEDPKDGAFKVSCLVLGNRTTNPKPNTDCQGAFWSLAPHQRLGAVHVLLVPHRRV
jgi:WD40 repeat protein